jgi:hypothetical protein
MYDIKAKVTKATETDVKLTGDWPTDCLQAPGSIGSTEILRKLTPGEVFETFARQTQHLEIYHAGNPLNLIGRRRRDSSLQIRRMHCSGQRLQGCRCKQYEKLFTIQHSAFQKPVPNLNDLCFLGRESKTHKAAPQFS